ncbi:MAG: hypothetical protein RL885_08185 [Planctomycetota bacterium]
MTDDIGVSKAPSQVVIRPLPKVIFLWPSWVVSLVCWIIAATISGKEEPWVEPGTLGLLFTMTFFVNMFFFSFDFGRTTSLTLAAVGLASLFIVLWADSQWGFLPGLKTYVWNEINIQANTQFYGFFTGFLFLILLVVFVQSRFHYYIIKHNEILHKVGYLGDVQRYPSPNLRMTKEIPDVFEYILLRAGRLIIHPSRSPNAIVIENVININRIEEDIQHLLSSLSVNISHQHDDDDDDVVDDGITG